MVDTTFFNHKICGSRVDAGSSLIEVVIGISLLGLFVVGVVDGAWTNVRVAASTRLRSEATSMLESSRHALRATPFSNCPHIDQSYLGRVRSADPDPNDDLSIEIDRYEYWSESELEWTDFHALDALACASDQELAHEFAIQRIGLSVIDGRRVLAAGVQVKTRAPEL